MEENRSCHGWTNYESWLVALWINNDEYWLNSVENFYKEEENLYRIAKKIEEFVTEKVEEVTDKELFVMDLTRAALNRVNWDELVKSLMPERYRVKKGVAENEN